MKIKEQCEFLLDVCKLIAYAISLGLLVTGGELWRTPEQQEIYVRTGRSKTMKSLHLERLAIDLNFFWSHNGKPMFDWDIFRKLGEYWESLNPKNRWGGNFDGDWNPNTGFKDWPHFERRA